MDIQDEYDTLTQSDEYTTFNSVPNDFYLVHVYRMMDAKVAGKIEFGFYSAEKDRMVIFETNPAKKHDEEEVFKDSRTIHELDLETVKISMDDALSIAEKTRQEKYKSEMIYKTIIILQNLGTQVWNITLVSLSFNIINIRIDAETGVVMESNIHNIMSLGKRD